MINFSSLFEQMGKFYELFEMDAHVGARELDLQYMKVTTCLSALNIIEIYFPWWSEMCVLKL